MRKIIKFDAADIIPSPLEVLEDQGMAGRRNLPARIKDLLDSALELFSQLAEPRGILEELPIADFEAIYNGSGKNSPEGPVPGIVRQAEALALFAATLGDALITKSSELFAKGGPALGYMLDAVNSSAAERLGALMGQRFLELLTEQHKPVNGLKVQYYSPGHCGWHISGQEKLFHALHPEEMGIAINPSWAMKPFKSISGILVVGDMEIHRFKPVFSFCKQCKEKKCLERLKILENTD
jgi:hypothetical protein